MLNRNKSPSNVALTENFKYVNIIIVYRKLAYFFKKEILMKQIVQLSEQITQKILYEITSGKYLNEKRLPPEVEIAAYLGVSRTLVRDCLAVLEREGFISRKHGVGTIINRHVINVDTRMDLEKEFLEMIEASGQRANIAYTDIKEVAADKEIAEKLQIHEADPIFHVTRMITADKKPAIYCIDHIAKKLLAEENYNIEELRMPIFNFLKDYCHIDVYMDLTEVKAVGANDTVAKFFKVEKGSPLLYMDEVGYTFKGDPVIYSKEYYMDGILKHMMLRKKI
ncbi:MAG: Transcriptional regulator [Clostridiales bacterium]|nr:Transcriptional regulator [Clostridiales bacterium]